MGDPSKHSTALLGDLRASRCPQYRCTRPPDHATRHVGLDHFSYIIICPSFLLCIKTIYFFIPHEHRQLVRGLQSLVNSRYVGLSFPFSIRQSFKTDVSQPNPLFHSGHIPPGVNKPSPFPADVLPCKPFSRWWACVVSRVKPRDHEPARQVGFSYLSWELVSSHKSICSEKMGLLESVGPELILSSHSSDHFLPYLFHE